MDINALLQMLQGGGGPSLQGGSGGISAPQAAPMGNPTLQMPQFAGAGGNAGPQQAAMATRQALSQPQQQQPPMGGMMGSSNPMMMAMMMQKMQNQNQPPPSGQVSFPDARGNPMQSTVQAPFPSLGGSTGLQGIFGRLFGG
jgi:hypothetical protein